MTTRGLFLTTLALCAACGDNASNTDSPDAAPSPDAPVSQPDASPDAPAPFTKPTPMPVVMSPAGPDQLQSATAGPNGTFYAAGYAAQTVAGPRFVVVVKLTSTGLDPSFGTGGVATTTLDFKGGSDEIDIATQPDGKIVVSATVANATTAADRDVALVRLTAAGVVDATFGDAGVRVLDLSAGVSNGTGGFTATDAARGLAIDAQGRIYLHAIQHAEGNITGGTTPRVDTDYVVVRLTAAGAVDTAWAGGDGKHLLDLYSGGAHSNATARGIIALADGSVIAGGYANTVGLGTTQPVLYKLTPAGVLDTAFADGGVFHDTVLTLQTEVYNFALHGNKVVTGGYGRNTGTTNDWVSLRFDVTTGARDLTWGGAPNGAVLFDPSGAMAGSNCRNAIALGGGRTLLTGSIGPGNMPAQDAAFAVLDTDGKLDTHFGTGIVTYPLGANGNDQFWGAVESGGKALIVGYKGGGTTQTETTNDDSYAVVLPL